MKAKDKDPGENEEQSFSREVERLFYRLVKDYESCDEACLARCGVTPSQGYTLLALPETGSISMNELSVTMDLANSTMTRMLECLVGKDLAYREHGGADRRIVLVGLTAKGRKLQKSLKEGRRSIIEAMLSSVRGEDRTSMLTGLRVLSDAVEKAFGACKGSCQEDQE